MGVMGAPISRARLSRAARVLFALTLLSGSLVVATGQRAHALVDCLGDPSLCPIANDDYYDGTTTDGVLYPTATFETTLKIGAANGLLVNDEGVPTISTHVDPDNSDTFTSNDGEVCYGSAPSCTGTGGGFEYTPPDGFTGNDDFLYEILDGNGNTSDAFVTITVRPIVTNDSYTSLRNQRLVVSAANGVLKNDKGFDDFTGTSLEVDGAHGDVVLGEDGGFTYTPATNFVGTDTFKYSVWDMTGENEYFGTATIHVNPPAPPPPPKPKGYWMVGATGTVYPFGQVKSYGNASTFPVTHIEPTPSKLGYWIVNGGGQVFAKGNAKFFGSFGSLRKGEVVSSMSSTPTGNGYWLFSSKGKVVAKGGAKFFGDVRNLALNGPIVGSVATPTGKGYYMVASDGGIFAFGDAKFFGSMGGKALVKPVNGIVPTATNHGYWLVASDGGIFAFGDAKFRGSMGGKPLVRPVIGMVRYGNGYLMVSSDGGIFNFSNLPFFGSLGGNPPAIPIVGVAAGG
jgi:hypothetical protein